MLDNFIYRKNTTDENVMKEILDKQAYRKKKINFGISLFRAQDLDKLDKIISQIDFFKVPSAECLNIYLLEELKTRNKPIFVSSGAHETDEVIKYLAAFLLCNQECLKGALTYLKLS